LLNGIKHHEVKFMSFLNRSDITTIANKAMVNVCFNSIYPNSSYPIWELDSILAVLRQQHSDPRMPLKYLTQRVSSEESNDYMRNNPTGSYGVLSGDYLRYGCGYPKLVS